MSDIANRVNRRLFRVLLGGILVGVSNIVVSGKGRRYRRGWEGRSLTGADLDEAFCQSVENAVGDILRYGERTESRYAVIRGDARKVINKVRAVDLAIFSPPYPNSFDYTDVYNVELWGLRYLVQAKDNRSLRLSTLASHVQIKRDYATAPVQSTLLKKTIKALSALRSDLWNPHIPEMVGGYFADMSRVILAVN